MIHSNRKECLMETKMNMGGGVYWPATIISEPNDSELGVVEVKTPLMILTYQVGKDLWGTLITRTPSKES